MSKEREFVGLRETLREDGSKRVQIFFPKVGMTEQSHKDDCDINNILQKYVKTGQVPLNFQELPSQGDFTEITDYHSAMCLVAEANSMFEELPAKIREEFDHDPGKFLAAVDDPEQKARLTKLGVLVDVPVEGSSEVPKEQESSLKASEGGVAP